MSQGLLWTQEHFLVGRRGEIILHSLRANTLTIPLMVLAEIFTFRTFIFFDQFLRTANGGFYPALPVAAYKRGYVQQLRFYDRPRTPNQYNKKRVTLDAQRNQKVSSKQVDPYMTSQSFYLWDKKAMLESSYVRSYQKNKDDNLSQPKRLTLKFPLRDFPGRH